MIGAMVVAGVLIIAAGIIFGDVVVDYLTKAVNGLGGSIPDVTMPTAPEGSGGE